MADRRWLKLAMVPLAAIAVACEPPLSDTGYVGTWTRGNERQHSNLFIDRAGDEYRFRIGVTTADGARRVTCDAEFHCAEFVRGQRTLDYRFRTRLEPGTKRLVVEYDVTPVRPDTRPFRYVDVLTLQDDGLGLKVETIERDGVKLEREGERPTRIFHKVSNRVPEP